MATIAERLRDCADSYEAASMLSSHARLRALRAARTELFHITTSARAELDHLVLTTAPKAPRPTREAWFGIVPPPKLVQYWCKYPQLRPNTVLILAKLGFENLDQLEQTNREQLLRTDHIGRRTLQEIEDVMMDNGRLFRGTGYHALLPPQYAEQGAAR